MCPIPPEPPLLKVQMCPVQPDADTRLVRMCPYTKASVELSVSDIKVEEPKSVETLRTHRIQQMIACYWRPAAAASILVALTEAARQRKVTVSAGLLGMAGIIAAADVAARRRRRLINKVKMHTPKTLDEMARKSNLAECDFSGAMSAIPMEGAVSLESLPSPHPRTTMEDVDDTALEEYQATLCYLRQFLAKPHHAVGRTGPVCPYMPKALRLESVKLSVVPTRNALQNDLRRVVSELLLDFIPQFEAMEPTVGRQRQYKAVVLIFPDVALSDATGVIDGAQADVKADFVARGLMVGEFHAVNNNCGLRNPDFYPLRTPYPCLAIRHMVPGDLAFMTLSNYAIDLQRKLLRSFLDVFGDDDREEVRSATKKLEDLAQC